MSSWEHVHQSRAHGQEEHEERKSAQSANSAVHCGLHWLLSHASEVDWRVRRRLRGASDRSGRQQQHEHAEAWVGWLGATAWSESQAPVDAPYPDTENMDAR